MNFIGCAGITEEALKNLHRAFPSNLTDRVFDFRGYENIIDKDLKLLTSVVPSSLVNL